MGWNGVKLLKISDMNHSGLYCGGSKKETAGLGG
jgi:hypothetical protein